MVNPLFYEFRRTMTSKTVLVSMIVIILISVAIIPVVKSFASPTPALGSTTSEVLEYRDSSGTYHFLGYSFNLYGQPLSGATYTITPAGSSSSQKFTTNSSGYASFQLQEPAGQDQLSLDITYPSSVGQGTFPSVTLPQSAVGQVVSLTGDQMVPVVDSVNGSRIDLLVTWEGANGSSPAGYSVYYSQNKSAVNGYVIPSSPKESEMVSLGQLGSYHQIFKLPDFSNNTRSLEFALFLPNGTSISAAQLPVSDFKAASITLQTGSIFSSFTAAILSIVVPLIAVLVAYGSYAKDRVSGVLESVLLRPISRKGLSVSRYLSIMLGLSTAIGVTILATSALALILIGSFSGLAEFAGYTFLSLVVEAAAFVGLVMLLSHLIKSTGALIGISVVLWVLFDFFWGTIVLAVSTALGYGVGSANYLAVSIDSYFFNPAQFYLLVGDYINNLFISTTGGNTVTINPATYGLSPLTIGLAGAFWVVVPFVLFLRLATKRD